MKRILIVGASSFIGSNLAVHLRGKLRVFGTYAYHRIRVDGIATFPLALHPAAPIEQFLTTVKPDVVVYCAGERSEERCTQDPLAALFVNAEAPLTMARSLRLWGGRMIYLSSSKVFSGNEGEYKEEHAPAPNTQYGISKLRAEQLLEGFEDVFILRLGTVFGMAGPDRDGVMNRLLDALWRNKSISVINDELRSFVSVDDVCRAIECVIGAKKKDAGTYHLGSAARETYYDFASQLAAVFEIDRGLINGVPGKTFSGSGFNPEQRGRDLSLHGGRFRSTFRFPPRPTPEALGQAREKLRFGRQ